MQSNIINHLTEPGQVPALHKLKQYKVILKSGGEEGFSDNHELISIRTLHYGR